MTQEGGRHIATAEGAMLADPGSLGNLADTAAQALFEPDFWRARGELAAVCGGRGAAWFIGAGPGRWVLRHFRRGGCMARWSQDRYIWAGEDRVRAFAEYRLLEELLRRGLPVPKPVAARYQRGAFTYRCDLITQRIVDAEPLSAILATAGLSAVRWGAIGATLADLHRVGVDHADLNAHNILLDSHEGIHVIDFDRGRLRAPGSWSAGNLRRLRRSLIKIARALPADRFSAQSWDGLIAGYESR